MPRSAYGDDRRRRVTNAQRERRSSAGTRYLPALWGPLTGPTPSRLPGGHVRGDGRLELVGRRRSHPGGEPVASPARRRRVRGPGGIAASLTAALDGPLALECWGYRSVTRSSV